MTDAVIPGANCSSVSNTASAALSFAPGQLLPSVKAAGTNADAHSVAFPGGHWVGSCAEGITTMSGSALGILPPVTILNADVYPSGECIRYLSEPANAGVSPENTGGRSKAASTLISPTLNRPEWVTANAFRQGAVSSSFGKSPATRFTS